MYLWKIMPGVLVMIVYVALWIALCIGSIVFDIQPLPAGNYGGHFVLASAMAVWFAWFFYSLFKSMKKEEVGSIGWPCFAIFLAILAVAFGAAWCLMLFDTSTDTLMQFNHGADRQSTLVRFWKHGALFFYVLSLSSASLFWETVFYLRAVFANHKKKINLEKSFSASQPASDVSEEIKK